MKDFIMSCKNYNTIGSWLVMLLSGGLLVASFVLPPTGVIDPSVLAAVGELGGFGVLFFKVDDMIQNIKDGTRVSFKKGDAEVSVHKGKDE